MINIKVPKYIQNLYLILSYIYIYAKVVKQKSKFIIRENMKYQDDENKSKLMNFKDEILITYKSK